MSILKEDPRFLEKRPGETDLDYLERVFGLLGRPDGLPEDLARLDKDAVREAVDRLSLMGSVMASNFTDVGAAKGDHFIHIGGLGQPAVASAAAAAADLASHNVPLAVIVGVTAELAQRYKHLSERERAVFDLLGRLAQGGSIYKVWIAEDELLAAMDPELELDDRKRLLANMKSRGLLEDGAGKWRAVW